MDSFSRVLRGLRKESGYRSPRAFFNGRGGRAFFGCTYRQYFNVETGRSKPQRGLAAKIAAGLRLEQDKGKARRFFEAYLLTMTESRDFVRLMLESLTPGPAGAAAKQPPLVGVMAGKASKRSRVLTKEQSRFVTASRNHYWPYAALTNDSGRWSVRDLAKTTGVPAAALRKVLTKLVRLGLAAKDKEGLYHCPDAGKVFKHPRDKIFTSELRPLREIWEEKARKGESLLKHAYMLRASEADLRQYFPYLDQCLVGSDVCSTTDRGPDTGFFLVQFGVSKLISF